MENKTKKPTSIDDALKVLDEALSGVNPPQLSDLISSEYRHLKSAIGRATSTSTESAHDLLSQLAGPIGTFGVESYEKVAEVAAVGLEQARLVGEEVDRSVRSNPWPYLGGVAVGSLALGVILGRQPSSQARI